jgi:hypothetical protein
VRAYLWVVKTASTTGLAMSMEIVAGSSANSRPIAGPKQGRSRITNGSRFLHGVDGRSPWVRRCKDIIGAHISDLGGEDNTSAAERSIVRRAAVLTTQAEMLEAKFALAMGDVSPDDLDLYARVAGNLRRLLEAVGLQRRPRDVGPSLGDLLREDLRQQREAAALAQEQR